MSAIVENRYKWLGLSGIVLVAMMVGGFVLDMAIIATTGAEPMIRLNNLSADLLRVQASELWAVEAWVYTLMLVPASLFALGVFWRFREDRRVELPAIGLMATLAFWALHTAHNVAILTVVTGLAPVYSPAAPDAASIEAAARVSIVASGILFLPGGGIGSLFWALAGLCFGRAALDTTQFPRWIGYSSIGGAICALLGYLQYVFPPMLALGLIGWIILMAWTAGISFSLIRGPAVTSRDRREEASGSSPSV